MRYVTTNIRLPEDLWKSLKMEAAEQGKRFAEVVRQRLAESWLRRRPPHKQRSLRGVWKNVKISDALFEEAKRSIFPSPEKFKNQ